MQFKFYVLNYNLNKDKVEMYNIFNNYHVQEETERAVKKYLRSPKNFSYKAFFNNNNEIIYGFDALCMKIDSIIRYEEWGRFEYEISVGQCFTMEIKDILSRIRVGIIKEDNLLEEIKELSINNSVLEKWDCYMQAHENIETITRDVIYQYKQQLNEKG